MTRYVPILDCKDQRNDDMTSLVSQILRKRLLKPGFHTSQFIGDLFPGIAEGENDFRKTKDFIHR